MAYSMSMISVGDAATRLGVSAELTKEWDNKGLLHVHGVNTDGGRSPDKLRRVVSKPQVDEEELAQVAGSLG